MADELAGVLCEVCKCLCEADAVKNCLCCLCKVCQTCSCSRLEHCVEGCCKGCCFVTDCCLRGCVQNSSTHASLHCVNISCGCVPLCLFLIAVYCSAVGVVSLTTAYRFGDNSCEEPIDSHVVVQGISMFGNALTVMYIACRYYVKSDIAFPYSGKAVFPRFHSFFIKDIPLTILLLMISLGFWWSLLGYYWLSKVQCEPEDAFLLTMDSYAIGSEFFLILFFLVLVYSILSIAACDEGSFTPNSLQLDCFLCCCECCLQKPEAFDSVRRTKSSQIRSDYPDHRNECLNFAMKTILFCGCIRSQSWGMSAKKGMEVTADHPPQVTPVVGAVWQPEHNETGEPSNRLVGLEIAVKRSKAKEHEDIPE